jgi:dipeptidyl aminopeptidase/acylaminoacyl peptidase
MYKIFIKLVVIGVLISSISTTADEIPLRHFAEFSAWSQISVSPGGQYLAGIVDASSDIGGSSLMVIDAKTLKNSHEIKMTGRGFISTFVWVSDDRLMAWEAMKTGIQEAPYRTGNIIAVNIDGTKKTWVYGSGKQSMNHLSRHSKRTSAEIVDRLPDDDRNVLMAVYTYGGEDGAYTRLVKLNTFTGREKNIARSPIKNTGLLVDGDGELRFAFGSDIDDGQAWKTFVRDGDDWRLIKRADKNSGSFVPVAFTPDNNKAYVLSNIETDTRSIYLYDLKTGQSELVYQHPFVDIDDFNLSTDDVGDNSGELAGVWVMPDYPLYISLNDDDKNNKLLATLQRQFPQYTVNIRSNGADKEGSKHLAVVTVRSDKHPGMFLLYDYQEGTLRKIRQAHSSIDPSKLSDTEPYKLTMRDGKTVYAYLTRPAGTLGPVPLIVHPHGGPYGVRDIWGYNPNVQMLASRGYAVLQVNFRGSGGYGKDFIYSAYKQWGAEMQDDLTDATRWAIDNGITKEGRVCIYGASYGGYAALMGAVKEPDLYKCAIGYVGVYDLEMMKNKGDIQRRDDGLEFINEAICSTPEECKKGSPITYIDALKADIMIVHGAIDQRVPIAHAEALRDELDKRDKSYEWMVKRKEGHGFVNVEHREELYQRLLAFLDKNIGAL